MLTPISLSSSQKTFWKQNGFLLLKEAIPEALVEKIQSWTKETTDWEETPGKWMKYFEKSTIDGKRMLARVENFVEYHPPFHSLITDSVLMLVLKELMGEEAVVFKEKINFKFPGGGAFSPHQDAPAFTTFKQDYHVTVLIPIDAATVENGCLYVVNEANHLGILQQNKDGTIADGIVQEMDWKALPVSQRDIFVFDSYVPHRSYPNQSSRSRRSLYITYNRKSSGNKRTEYFTHKRNSFPPECERIPGVDYSKWENLYNLGNPIE